MSMSSGPVQQGDPITHAKMAPSAQKRLLALDGGGIRGLIAIEVLAEIERILRASSGRGDAFRLADYFDYVAGPSTGAIIGTCVSLGMSVSQIRQFYDDNGSAMFDKASVLQRLRNEFDDRKLAQKLREVFDGFMPQDERARGDEHLTLGSRALKTLLLVVMRNASTDSPWPLSSNPLAWYAAPERPDCNLRLPLWQLVRASTAAPFYFPPEQVDIGDHRFLFVDGGVTTYNNPAFLLFLMATMRAYRLEWPTGGDRLLLVSVGTGIAAKANEHLSAADMNLRYNASTIPNALIFAAQNQQDLLCRVFGRCRAGAALDREVGALREEDGVSAGIPKLFTYLRYNADLSRDGLDRVGLSSVVPEEVQQMDSVDHVVQLREVGSATAQQVAVAHFAGFA
jgi:hypothetical protein